MMIPNVVQILVLEDDEGDFMMIERGFEKAGIANPLVRAYDGIEALEMLRGENGKEQLRRPFVILSDINMPRMDGLSFVEQLRADPEFSNAAVFILTTSQHDEDKHRAYGSHVAGYVLKSKAGKDFLELVTMLGGYAKIVELE